MTLNQTFGLRQIELSTVTRVPCVVETSKRTVSSFMCNMRELPLLLLCIKNSTPLARDVYLNSSSTKFLLTESVDWGVYVTTCDGKMIIITAS